MRVTKVHRAVSFEEAPVFKAYVDYNTAKRASSTSAFRKAYYKLKSNTLYGKCVENIRKRLDLQCEQIYGLHIKGDLQAIDSH